MGKKCPALLPVPVQDFLWYAARGIYGFGGMRCMKAGVLTWRRALFALTFLIVLLATLGAAMRYTVKLDGIPLSSVKQINEGWYLEKEGQVSQVDSLPCQVDQTDSTLVLAHDFTNLESSSQDVLVIQTRYHSIRVWADDRLVYEAAQG